MAPSKCNVPAAAKISVADVDSLREESKKKKDEDARKAAADKITELANAASFAEEPYLIDLLEVAINLAGDNKSANVRAAGDAAARLRRAEDRLARRRQARGATRER